VLLSPAALASDESSLARRRSRCSGPCVRSHGSTAGYLAIIRSSAPPPTGAPLPDGGGVRKGTCLRLKQEESGKGRKWRDAASNRGHHDFQPRCSSGGRSGICRTNAKNLAAFDGNVTATLSRPCVHAAPAHFLAPHASLSTLPYLVGPRARSGPDPGYYRGARGFYSVHCIRSAEKGRYQKFNGPFWTLSEPRTGFLIFSNLPPRGR